MSNIVLKKESATITYLRGLASLGVVVYHVREDLWIGWDSIHPLEAANTFDRLASLLSIPSPYMGSGVILFFLLSGFCIALPYVGINPRKFEFKEYVARRFFRIYPPYFFAIVLTLMIEFLLHIIVDHRMSPLKTYLANLGMIQNYTTGALVTNGSLWTLPIEMELYITFPLVLFILLKFGSKALLWVSGVVSVAGLAIYLSGVNWLLGNFAMYWLIWTSGATLAHYYVQDVLRVPSKWIIILGVLSLAIALLAHRVAIPSASFTLLYGCFYLILLWLGLTTEHKWNSKVPRVLVKCLTILGTCSYSLYLIHKPLFRLCGIIWIDLFGGKPINFFIPLGFVALAVLIAWWFYRIIEMPSHILAKKAANIWRIQPQLKTEKESRL